MSCLVQKPTISAEMNLSAPIFNTAVTNLSNNRSKMCLTNCKFELRLRASKPARERCGLRYIVIDNVLSAEGSICVLLFCGMTQSQETI